MPQMVNIQPTAPKSSPKNTSAASTGNKETKQFSPHLENAISNKKQQQPAATDGKTRKGDSSSSDKKIMSDDNSQSPAAQELSKNTETSATTVNEDLDQTDNSLLGTATSLPVAGSVIPGSPIFVQLQHIKSSIELLQKLPSEIAGNQETPGKFFISETMLSELTSALKDPAPQNSMKPLATNAQEALLSQLQQIIDNANETGTVSITQTRSTVIPDSLNRTIHGLDTLLTPGKSESIIAAATTATSEPHPNGLLSADSIDKTIAKPTLQSTGQRHDSHQQIFNTKINMQNLAENDQNPANKQQSDSLSQQNTNVNQQSNPFGTSEPTNTFSQILPLTQEAPAQPSTEIAKAIILPSGTIVHEDEVIQQLTQRFEISNKHLDSRINLKLHPAELGELKIDLSVKEGSIRAHVVAQSQHTLDILEKNISKLKNILEKQGFTIDQISVTAESDSVGDFDLFDSRLFSRNQYIPTAQQEHHDDEAIFTLDENVFAAPAMSTGVNVKI